MIWRRDGAYFFVFLFLLARLFLELALLGQPLLFAPLDVVGQRRRHLRRRVVVALRVLACKNKNMRLIHSFINSFNRSLDDHFHFN